MNIVSEILVKVGLLGALLSMMGAIVIIAITVAIGNPSLQKPFFGTIASALAFVFIALTGMVISFVLDF